VTNGELQAEASGNPEQGDQIGRIFVNWANVYFGQFFENYRIIPHFWTTFFTGENYVLISTKNGLGFILGECFTNASGHPDPEPCLFQSLAVSLLGNLMTLTRKSC
jgi:hypothetical protein